MDSLHSNSLPTYATPFPPSTLTSAGSLNTFLKVSAVKEQEETNLWFPTKVKICTNGISWPDTPLHKNEYAPKTRHILLKKKCDEHVLGFLRQPGVDQFANLACFKGHKAF